MRGELRVLDPTGHTAMEWDTEVKTGPLDPTYVEEEFDRIMKQGGFFAVGTKPDGENVQIKAFDPETYPEITISPQLVGG